MHVHTKGPRGREPAAVGTDPTRPLKLAAIISTCNHKSTEGGCKQTSATSVSTVLRQETRLQRRGYLSNNNKQRDFVKKGHEH